MSICPSSRGEKNRGDSSKTRHRTTAAAAPEGSALMGGDTSLPFPKEKHKKSLCLAKFGRRGPTAFLVGEKMGALRRRRRRGLSLNKPEHSSFVRGKKMRDDDLFLGGKRRAAAEREEGSGGGLPLLSSYIIFGRREGRQKEDRNERKIAVCIFS